MDGALGISDVSASSAGRRGEIFDRAWQDMGLQGYIPLSEIYQLLERIDVVRHRRRRMTNDPGVVLGAQRLIHRVQDMFGKEAAAIDILKEDSVMMLGWILSESGDDEIGITAVGTLSKGSPNTVGILPQSGPDVRRISLYDSDETSDEETASLMEGGGMGCNRSTSITSRLCDCHIDHEYSKVQEFSLSDILDELEEHHLRIEEKFVSMDRQLNQLRTQNANHIQYLKNVGSINNGLHERIRHIRHEVVLVQDELNKLFEERGVKEDMTVGKKPSAQIDLVGTIMSSEDTQIYQKLSQSSPLDSSNNSQTKDATTKNIQANVSHNFLTIIAFISIILIISHFNSK